MKKIAIVFVLLLTACQFTPPAAQSVIRAEIPKQQINTYELFPGESVEVIGNGCTLEGNITSGVWSIVCIDGNVPPTDTPIPPLPPTNTPPPASGNPDINAPYCEDIGLQHDHTAWHPHWNANAGCFWDEFHGDDPNAPEIVAIFGEKAEPIFSHVHASSPIEHTVKHLGDFVFTSHQGDPRHIPCGIDTSGDRMRYDNKADNFSNSATNDCVTAYRIIAHFDDAGLDAAFVDHSYSAEYQVCTIESNYTDCGIVRVKGFMFYANFRAPQYTARDLRPGCNGCELGFGYPFSYPPDADNPNITQIVNDEPYVQYTYNDDPLPDGSSRFDWLLAKSGRPNFVSWSMNEISRCGKNTVFPDGLCRNNYLRFAEKTFDPGVLPNEGDFNNPYILCFGQEHCSFDASKRGIFETQVYIPQEWDALDGANDGHLTGVLWVDRYQQPHADQGFCTDEMLGTDRSGDCFQMEFESYPVGVAANKINASASSRHDWYLREYNQCEPNFDCKVRRD